MGLLDRIRNRAGLLVGAVALALLAFIVGDGLRSGTTWFSQNQQVALSIDGEDVSIQDYESRLHAMSEQMQRQSGQQLTDEQRMAINNQLSQQMIADFATKKLADQIGIKVTADELFALMHAGNGIQPSPVAQQFFSSFGIDMNNAQAINDFISQMSDKQIDAMPAEQQSMMRGIQSQWQNVQRTIITNRIQEKISALLSRSYKITKLDEELATSVGSRTVALVRTTAPAISDSTQRASDADIKKYYDEHKNFFRMQQPVAEISYISLQVTPSSADYKASEATAAKALSELQSATAANVKSVVRNHSGNTFGDAYLTGSELDQLGLSAEDVAFIKSSEVGATKSSGLVSDKYNIIKLIGKKTSTEAVGVRVIALDSVMGKKTDSLLNVLRGGADFAEMATRLSVDKSTAVNGGLILFPNQFGGQDSTVTELMATQLQLPELFSKPIGEPFVLDRGSKIIVKTVNAKPAVEKYQIASVTIDAPFSDKTYNERFDALNQILAGGGKFDDMIAKAQKQGFAVAKNEAVATSSPQLGRIPGSRSVINWALNAEEGDITEKVHRIGSDYLVIANVSKHFEPGYAPLSMVRDGIAARLESEKRAATLAQKLEAKKFTTLDAYASDLGAQIDTLVGVNYQVRGSEGAAFNGRAMTTPIGQLSKPFVSGMEVMVVQPISKEAPNAESIKSQSKQQEANVGYQLFSRAFSALTQSLKVEDNRARFY